jgi:hypothetical protein
VFAAFCALLASVHTPPQMTFLERAPSDDAGIVFSRCVPRRGLRLTRGVTRGVALRKNQRKNSIALGEYTEA